MEKKSPLYNNLLPFITCKDNTGDGEDFQVLKNDTYQMLVTYPVPANLHSYYKSDKYISHTNSRKSLFDKVYQRVRKYTLQKKLSLITSFKSEGKRILDVGAGTGDFLSICKKNGWAITGIEPSANARAIAHKKGISLEEDIYSLPLNSFDIITLWHVLEHVENLQEYIVQLQKLLKPNGVLLIAVPNYKSFDAIHYKQFWAAYDVPRHLWHFSQFSIQKLFKEVDMNIVETKPMLFDSYYVSLLSQKYKSSFMNPFKAFYVGWRSNLKAKRTSEYSSLIYVLKNS